MRGLTYVAAAAALCTAAPDAPAPVQPQCDPTCLTCSSYFPVTAAPCDGAHDATRPRCSP